MVRSRSRFGKIPILALFVQFLRPHRATIAKAFACTLGFTAFWPVLAWLVGRIAQYIGAGDVSAIARIAGLSAVIFLVRGAMQFGQDMLMAKAALAIALDLRLATFDRLQKLSIRYFITAKTGDLAYRLTEDIDRVGEVTNKVFHQFIPSSLQLVVVLGYMVWLNWQLTLATFVIAPLMAVLIGWFGEKLLGFSRRARSQASNLAAAIAETFAGIRLVQAFAAEEYTSKRFAFEAERNRRFHYLAERIKALQFVIVGFFEAMSVVLLFFLGAWQIARNNLTAAEFASYLAAVAMLIDPIGQVTSNYNEFKQGQASLDRIFELFELQPDVIEKPNAADLPEVTGKVEYCNISFTYLSTDSPLGTEKRDPWVLKNLNLLGKPGETIALVGSSGAGKSTLVNLLPRFYDPQAGQILIDGIDIGDVTLSSLRRQIGIVPQETILFSGTIADNIAFGRENYELPEVEKAAKVANADRFIAQLPQGYYTQIGERGIDLSGGQRQRIAIARAVLLDPRILILDEATSALDSESEALVQEALERLTRDRTVFVIAHRLATVRNADRILVLEKGQIVEAGTHEELLAKGDRYSQFYAKQFEVG